MILPISVINEVRNLPENKVSFMKEVARMFVSKHTGIGDAGPEVANVVRFELTRHIASALEDLQDEIRYGFDKEFGECKDWTAVPLYSQMARIVALLSGRVFVGRPLSREEEWIHATINFTLLANETRVAVKTWPEWCRGIVAPFLPEVRKVKKFKKRGGELLKPILDAQMANEKHERIINDVTSDEQGTFISWLLAHTKEHERGDPIVLASNQMGCKLPFSQDVFCNSAYNLKQCPLQLSILRLWLLQLLSMILPPIPNISNPFEKKSKMFSMKMDMIWTVTDS